MGDDDSAVARMKRSEIGVSGHAMLRTGDAHFAALHAGYRAVESNARLAKL